MWYSLIVCFVSFTSIPAIIYADKAKSSTDDMMRFINVNTSLFDSIQICYYAVLITSLVVAVVSATMRICVKYDKCNTRPFKVLKTGVVIANWLCILAIYGVGCIFTSWLTQTVGVRIVANTTLNGITTTLPKITNFTQDLAYAVSNITSIVQTIEPYIPNSAGINTTRLNQSIDLLNTAATTQSVCPPYCMDLSYIGQIFIEKRCICPTAAVQTVATYASDASSNLIVALPLATAVFAATTVQIICMLCMKATTKCDSPV